jgi:hypothetical protein
MECDYTHLNQNSLVSQKQNGVIIRGVYWIIKKLLSNQEMKMGRWMSLPFLKKPICVVYSSKRLA